MQHLFITRHGQSTDNANKIIGGGRDVMLTELGKHQMVMAGRKAKSLHIDLIICSPLVRARMSADIVAEAIGYPPQKIKVIPELTERNFGILEGLPEGSGGSHEEVNATAGVETLPHLLGRAQQVLRLVSRDHAHHNVLLVCHFWIGRMLRVTLDGKPPEAIYQQLPLPNGVIEELI